MKRHILTHTGQKPFKCPECPLWFTTKSNMDRHLVRKHSNNNCYEGDASSENDETKRPNEEGYKCYLCEDGQSTKEDALKHLQNAHPEDYASLVAKGAFEETASQADIEQPQTHEFEAVRGQFPDYANRRVICLFCQRKFWSAEDLRRHVRTHTGEKPYECDICHRKFTLKHSMLRHKKKHDSGVSSGEGEDTDSEAGSAVTGHSSMSSVGRSSSPELNGLQVVHSKEQVKKKKPSLMDKINQLAAATGSTIHS